MFYLKANNWIMEQTHEHLEKVHENFNTLKEAIKYGESKGFKEFKVFTHQSEMCHWFQRKHTGCDFS